MNWDVLRESLAAFGTVTYCDYNGDRRDDMIIVIESFNGDLDDYNQVINEQVRPTFPYDEAFSVDEDNKLKAAYDQTPESRSS